jgi:hypothetical protein
MDAAAVNVIALLLSPVLAVGVTLWYQHTKERRDAKVQILNTLMQTRHQSLPTDERVRALNMIDVVFRDSTEVRSLWHQYFDMLANDGLNNPLGYSQRNKKYLELLAEMARDVGYGRTLTHLDIDRVYTPIGLGKYNERSEAMADEFLRVLKAVQGPAVPPVPAEMPAPAPPSLPPTT